MSVWMVEESDPSGCWYPLDGWAHNMKKDALEAAKGRRGYNREMGYKDRVRIREYTPVEDQS